jgi:hypothetical protein
MGHIHPVLVDPGRRAGYPEPRWPKLRRCDRNSQEIVSLIIQRRTLPAPAWAGVGKRKLTTAELRLHGKVTDSSAAIRTA